MCNIEGVCGNMYNIEGRNWNICNIEGDTEKSVNMAANIVDQGCINFLNY